MKANVHGPNSTLPGQHQSHLTFPPVSMETQQTIVRQTPQFKLPLPPGVRIPIACVWGDNQSSPAKQNNVVGNRVLLIPARRFICLIVKIEMHQVLSVQVSRNDDADYIGTEFISKRLCCGFLLVAAFMSVLGGLFL